MADDKYERCAALIDVALRVAYDRGRREERERCAALVESIGEQTGGVAGAVVRGISLAIRHMPEEESDG